MSDLPPTAADPAKRTPTLRLFVALPLWGEFRERNLERYRSLRALPHDLKWVRPEHWHITLKFLGPVPESAVPDLIGALERGLESLAGFDFEVDGLGGFPRLSKCRVLWAGVSEGREKMNRLAAAVAAACRETGYPGDRKNFQAHLTLARSRGDSIAMQIPKELFKATWGWGRADSIALVKSTLGPGGPQYEVLKDFPLGGAGEDVGDLSST